MDALLIDTIIDKVDLNEKRLSESERQIADIDQQLAGISTQTENLQQLSALVKRLQDSMTQIKWPVNEINQMTFHLKLNNDLLANPAKTKQAVVHTLGNLGWVIAGLSVVSILMIFWIFNLFGRMDQYKTNDLLWRYIKVANEGQNLKYLQSIEKKFLANPESIKTFVDEEELNQKQFSESKIGDQAPNPSDSASSSTKKKEKRNTRPR